MSNYENLVKVFPQRCLDILKMYPLAKWADREVTLMITVASAGLTIPIERLEKKRDPYPFRDRVKHPKVQTELDKLLATQFRGSILLAEHPKSWCLGSLASTRGDPDEWPELQHPTTMPQSKTVCDVIKHIRNSLAHGSIHTHGNPITELIFVASARRGSTNFKYAMVSPDDFYEFLQKWFEFWKALEF